MSPRSRQLADRRKALVVRCQSGREQLARAVRPFESAFRFGDRALRVAGMLRAHPVLSGLVGAAIMIGGRVRLLRLIAIALPFVGPATRVSRLIRRS